MTTERETHLEEIVKYMTEQFIAMVESCNKLLVENLRLMKEIHELRTNEKKQNTRN